MTYRANALSILLISLKELEHFGLKLVIVKEYFIL